MDGKLNTVDCGDGILRELAKEDWGQLTLRTVKPGCEAGGHCHPNTVEMWWVVSGEARIRLEYESGWSYDVHPGMDEIVTVPPGVRHWIRNLGESDVTLIYWADKWYEEQEKA